MSTMDGFMPRDDEFMPRDNVEKLLCNDGGYCEFSESDRFFWADQIKEWADTFANQVAWYAIDQHPFGNPREKPMWRIERIVGLAYVWGGTGFATFDEARLHVIEKIRIWRETYGKDRVNAHKRFKGLGLDIPESIRALRFRAGFADGGPSCPERWNGILCRLPFGHPGDHAWPHADLRR